MSKRSFRLFVLLFLFLLVVVLAPTTRPMSFNLAGSPISNSCNDKDRICLQGDASLIQDGIIQLTANRRDKNVNGSVGWAYYSSPLLLWDKSTGELTNFTTNFSFIIKPVPDSQLPMADGMAFFLSSYPRHAIPQEAYSEYPGGTLGLMTIANYANASDLVAVEIDTLPNNYGAYNWDPSSMHIGIDINSIKSVVTKDLFPMGYVGDISSKVTVSYDASTQNLSVLYFNQSGVISVAYVVDLRLILPSEVVVGFSAATGASYEYHSVVSWEFESTLDDVLAARNKTLPPSPGPDPSYQLSNNTGIVHVQTDKKRSKVGLLVGTIVPAVGLIIGLVIIGLWLRRSRQIEKGNEFDLRGGTIYLGIQDPIDQGLENDPGSRRFNYRELVEATNNFSDDKKLGVGGFGAVYGGFLPDTNLKVAIKRLSKDSKQGTKEYISEINIISRLRHKNLVRLVGWCHEVDLLLVYEYMTNGSLDHHLFKKDRLLPWSVRYNISLGLASALLYLHTEWDQCVVHRDIKSSNVMLDDDFNAKLGDFGLARLIDHGSGMNTTIPAGTLGYMDPECYVTGKSSKESDVYSFGIVLLEIACGRRPIEPALEEDNVKLLDWVWSLYANEQVLQAADPRLEGTFDETQMERLMAVGLWCANPDRRARPTMRQAIAALNFEVAAKPSLPRKMPVPIYYSSPMMTMVGELSTEPSGSVASTSHSAVRNSTSGTDHSCTISSKSTSPSVGLLSSV